MNVITWQRRFRTMATLKLAVLFPKVLRNSSCQFVDCANLIENSGIHISIPEFLWTELYNAKHQIMGINGRGNRGRETLQKGVREPLFCEACEQHFNEYCEKPFRARWIETEPLPNPWEVEDIHWVRFDYASFKLFHLSVLFRASVSTPPDFATVSLGPHEEKLRELLLLRNPGEYWQYPIFGFAVVHHETKRLISMVSQAVQSRVWGQRCYGMIYGGVQWWIGVSSHRNMEFELACLQSDGSMPFHARPWNEVPVIQSAAEALSRASRRQGVQKAVVA